MTNENSEIVYVSHVEIITPEKGEKTSMKKGIIIAIVLVAVVGIWMVSGYNGLVTKAEAVDSAFSNIDTNLQRRADLIPNLVSTVKGYASHEQEAIDSVTEARAKLSGAQTVEELANADSELTSALNRLMVIVENYPDLKASENFIQLSDELAGTENRIATARRDYNEVVQSYNSGIRKFPTNILAGLFGFSAEPYFEAADGADVVPEVNFD